MRWLKFSLRSIGYPKTTLTNALIYEKFFKDCGVFFIIQTQESEEHFQQKRFEMPF